MKLVSHATALTLGAVVAAQGALLAQGTTPYQTIPGLLKNQAWLGAGLSVLGDVDGDGLDDFVVAAPSSDQVVTDAGEIFVYSGADGALIRSAAGTDKYEFFGMTVAGIGDVDADGVPDYAAGATGAKTAGVPTGAVYAYSGSDGSQLWRVAGPGTPYGSALAAAGDVNADGTPDVVVAGGGGSGFVDVLSGSDGSVLRTWSGAAPGELFGAAVAGPGDLDGDGFDDVVVTSPASTTLTFGHAEVFSGQTGLVLFQFQSTKLGDGYGGSAAGLGDVDADGVPDFAITAAKGARVRVYSGATGAVLWKLFQGGQQHGVSAAGDWNGDGHADFLVSDPGFSSTLYASGIVQVYSGLDKSVLEEFFGPQAFTGLGASVAAGDLNGDGKPDVLAGAPNQALCSGPVECSYGGAYTFLGGCAEVVSYCTAGTSASGCAAALSAAGTASATAPSGFAVSATGVEGDKRGLFFFGTAGRQAAPWGNGSSFQCVVPPLRRTPLQAKSGTPGACDGTFALDLNAHWTAQPSQRPAAGQVLQTQFWYRDPASASNQPTSLSDALEATVCP